jgi:hypothetical protein
LAAGPAKSPSITKQGIYRGTPLFPRFPDGMASRLLFCIGERSKGNENQDERKSWPPQVLGKILTPKRSGMAAEEQRRIKMKTKTNVKAGRPRR